MAEVEKHQGSSTLAKWALGLGIGGSALGLSNASNSGGGLLGNLFGGSGSPPAVAFQGGYVTEKEMMLRSEISQKDDLITKISGEKYTDAAVKSATDALSARLCALETAAAVNAQSDSDWRRFASSTFVHQPKATINDYIVTCQQRGCDCGCDCHRGHC